MALSEELVNKGIAQATGGAVVTSTSVYNYHYMDMKGGQGSVAYKRNDAFGLTAYHLFNDLEAGLKAGWQGEDSPIGIGCRLTYGLNQYQLRFQDDPGYRSYKLQSIRACVDVNISPFRYMLEDYGWCPLVELGATYVMNIACSTPYGHDTDQTRNGLRSQYAIGTLLGEDGRWAILLAMEMAHYDLLNSSYTPDGGITCPYEGFSSKDLNFSLKMKIRLFDD